MKYVIIVLLNIGIFNNELVKILIMQASKVK